MAYPEIKYLEDNALDLSVFREMDYYAVDVFDLSIELMMENAGLQLANLIAGFARKDDVIRIGVGNGNNGGGGLVAARRLSAWGFSVFLDPFTEITKELPLIQLNRALKFGAEVKSMDHPDVWIDAYLGFSQRLPLEKSLISTLQKANHSSAIKISLDIPTGFSGESEQTYFEADKILTLAAPKKILSPLIGNTEIYIADLGIPKEVYLKFAIEMPPFYKNNLLKLLP